MSMYIFISNEGFTYQPDSESIEPDIENCQVIGFSEGINSQEAFLSLVKDNEYLKETSFNEIFSLQLRSDKRTYLSLNDYKDGKGKKKREKQKSEKRLQNYSGLRKSFWG